MWERFGIVNMMSKSQLSDTYVLSRRYRRRDADGRRFGLGPGRADGDRGALSLSSCDRRLGRGA